MQNYSYTKYESEGGHRQGMAFYFSTKGASMKWWMLLIVFGLPLAGHAEEQNNKALEIGMLGYQDQFPSKI